MSDVPTATKIAALEEKVRQLQKAHADVACENARLTNDMGIIGNRASMDREEIDSMAKRNDELRADIQDMRSMYEERSEYAERLLAENVRLTNEAAEVREDLANARAWIDGQDVRSDFKNATAMRNALDRERERVLEWNVLVAQGCTPGGSEFHDCPQNVAYYIKERLADKDRIMKSQQKELNKERERCGVLEREVKAWRHWNIEDAKVGGDDEVDANANAAWGLLECCQQETDTRHALDAAKFVGGGQ